MSEMNDKLDEIYKSVDELRTMLQPFEQSLVRAKHKRLKEQSISDLVKSASLVESIREALS